MNIKEIFVILIIVMVALTGCNHKAASIGIIGGADGPTSILVGEVQETEANEVAAQVVSVEHDPMENGMEKVKEVAKYITKSNAEDDVAYAIEELLKNKVSR